MPAPRKADIVEQLSAAGITPPTGKNYNKMTVTELRAHARSSGLKLSAMPTAPYTPPPLVATSSTPTSTTPPTPRRKGPIEALRPKLGGIKYALKWALFGLGVFILILLLALFLKRNWDPFTERAGDAWNDDKSAETTQVVAAVETPVAEAKAECVVQGVDAGLQTKDACTALMALAAQAATTTTSADPIVTNTPQTDEIATATTQSTTSDQSASSGSIVKRSHIGMNMYQGNQVQMPATVPTDTTIYIHGDVDGTGSCEVLILQSGEQIPELSEATWQAYSITGGTPDMREALAIQQTKDVC